MLQTRSKGGESLCKLWQARCAIAPAAVVKLLTSVVDCRRSAWQTVEQQVLMIVCKLCAWLACGVRIHNCRSGMPGYPAWICWYHNVIRYQCLNNYAQRTHVMIGFRRLPWYTSYTVRPVLSRIRAQQEILNGMVPCLFLCICKVICKYWRKWQQI